MSFGFELFDRCSFFLAILYHKRERFIVSVSDIIEVIYFCGREEFKFTRC